jgi:hypothetical protein
LTDSIPKGSTTDLPIFIVGMMRSGTTLVEQILSSHPDVGPRGEQQFWMRRGSEAFTAGSHRIDPTKLARLASEYLEVLKSLYPEAIRLTDKMRQDA